jgi:release factor glutamine methyltransferase
MSELELIFCHILNCKRSHLYLEPYALDEKGLEEFSYIAEKRARGEPLQYILGQTEFMGLNFRVTQGVFIPRPETEILSEEALEIIESSGLKRLSVLDLCTGCGNIAVSLAKLSAKARVIAVDISGPALEIAKSNAKLNSVQNKIKFIQADIFQPSTFSPRLPAFDLIVSNPPYVPASSLRCLPLEVQFEPKEAIDGGPQGLDFYPRIVELSISILKPGGYLLMELGEGQREAVKGFLKDTGRFNWIRVRKDYQGIDRVIIAKKDINGSCLKALFVQDT